MGEYVTFDGDWDAMRLSDEDVAILEDITARTERKALCDHWELYISEAIPRRRWNGHLWSYIVFVSMPAFDRNDEPLVWETVIVSNFGALLKLITLLKAADIESVSAVVLDNSGD